MRSTIPSFDMYRTGVDDINDSFVWIELDLQNSRYFLSYLTHIRGKLEQQSNAIIITENIAQIKQNHDVFRMTEERMHTRDSNMNNERFHGQHMIMKARISDSRYFVA